MMPLALFEHISPLVLVFLLLTLNMELSAGVKEIFSLVRILVIPLFYGFDKLCSSWGENKGFF